MAARHKSRERSLQVLYQWDLLGHSIDRSIESYYEFFSSPEEERPPAPDPFMIELVRGVAARVEEIDASIVRHSAHWRIAIDEALKLAKRFSGDESIPFINGVLDAVRKEREGEAA